MLGPRDRTGFRSGGAFHDRDRHEEQVGPRRPELRQHGVLQRRLRAQGHRRAGGVPGDPAGRGRPDRGLRCGGGRVVDRDVDRRVDRPTNRPHPLPGQVLQSRRGARATRRVLRLRGLRHRPLRGGVDRQPDVVDHRQRLRVQAAEGVATRGHADPGRLREDVPGSGTRHRDGAGVPQQVRSSAPRGHHQAQARSVRAQLRPRRLRGLPRGAGLHQGRREHQQPAVHAVARPVPLRDGGRQQSHGRDG